MLDVKIKGNGLRAWANLMRQAESLEQKAIVQSANKAAGKMNTKAKRTVAEAMGVSQKFIVSRVGKPFEVKKAKSSGKLPLGGAEVKVTVKGGRIRLIHFSAKEKTRKRRGVVVSRQGVTAWVWGRKVHYRDVFIAPVRYGVAGDRETLGVFDRKGPDRLPIEQLYGPGPAREAERHEDEIMAFGVDEMRKIFPAQLQYNITKFLEKQRGAR